MLAGPASYSCGRDHSRIGSSSPLDPARIDDQELDIVRVPAHVAALCRDERARLLQIGRNPSELDVEIRIVPTDANPGIAHWAARFHANPRVLGEPSISVLRLKAPRLLRFALSIGLHGDDRR